MFWKIITFIIIFEGISFCQTDSVIQNKSTDSSISIHLQKASVVSIKKIQLSKDTLQANFKPLKPVDVKSSHKNKADYGLSIGDIILGVSLATVVTYSVIFLMSCQKTP